MVQHESGVSPTDVIPVVFYDTEEHKDGCDKSARGRDTHTYRLVSGNAIEERLLKKSIKHDSRTGCSGKGLFNRLFISGLFGNQ
ncbi:E1A-binding protein p400-like isoform X2 [Passer domesticus]|uniref:E1A-binding protein p400-like isoform X2 n=1 Tax=Passer domesticus TaxID=48849 RepID=UPI0030FF3473